MVEKRIVSSFTHILNAKIYSFRKKILRFVLSALVIGFVMPIGGFSGLTTAGIIFLAIMLIYWPLIYLSAKSQAQTMDFDAIVEFEEDKIKVIHQNKDLTETKEWTWIQRIEFSKDKVWLTLKQTRPLLIALSKSKLTNEEIDFFKRKANNL